MSKRPTTGNGKICYLEIPAKDINTSAKFYEKCFEWTLRRDGDSHISFDDGVGEVSGMWVTDKSPMSNPGIVISIMVDSADQTSKVIETNGGKVIDTMTLESGEIIVHFTDPAGNYLGLYQEAKK